MIAGLALGYYKRLVDYFVASKLYDELHDYYVANNDVQVDIAQFYEDPRVLVKLLMQKQFELIKLRLSAIATVLEINQLLNDNDLVILFQQKEDDPKSRDQALNENGYGGHVEETL